MSQCIKELSLDDRPREKLMQQGAAGLSNSELLAILIRTGTQKRSALRIAEELTASNWVISKYSLCAQCCRAG